MLAQYMLLLCVHLSVCGIFYMAGVNIILLVI